MLKILAIVGIIWLRFWKKLEANAEWICMGIFFGGMFLVIGVSAIDHLLYLPQIPWAGESMNMNIAPYEEFYIRPSISNG